VGSLLPTEIPARHLQALGKIILLFAAESSRTEGLPGGAANGSLLLPFEQRRSRELPLMTPIRKFIEGALTWSPSKS